MTLTMPLIDPASLQGEKKKDLYQIIIQLKAKNK